MVTEEAGGGEPAFLLLAFTKAKAIPGFYAERRRVVAGCRRTSEGAH
jgi:hypothetical protein